MSRQLPRRAVEKLLEVGAEGAEGTRLSAETEAGVVDLGAVDLGKYRIIRELGRGGMGRVYEAQDTLLLRRVALKLMPETAGLSEVLRRRFAREAQAAGKLSHPNIAAVYDATPDYIAMQLVEGCSVFDVPRDDPKVIVSLLRDAALAVQYAHENGVVHRDLKPSNLMVEGLDSTDGDPRIFVLDMRRSVEFYTRLFDVSARESSNGATLMVGQDGSFLALTGG